MMMTMITPNSRAYKEENEKGELKGGYGGIWRKEEGNADYGGMVRPSQQHVAPYVKRGWVRIRHKLFICFATFWTGIPLEVTQEAGVASR